MDHMEQSWDAVFKQYVNHLISPDGRDTFESTPQLIQKILSAANIQSTDTVVDVGCGWGNLTIPAVAYSSHVIGIEPNPENRKEAQVRSKGKSIQYLHGSFEKPNYYGKADKIISSLVFHQVGYDEKPRALRQTSGMLKADGCFVLCDTMMMFDAENDAARFNEVYRYLLPKTTPKEVYRKYIEPNMEAGYVYTWEDMKKYTPKDNWFYGINDLKSWLSACELKILDKIEICPFFGIIIIIHQEESTSDKTDEYKLRSQ